MDEMGAATCIEYGSRGAMTGIKNPLGHYTEHVHDERGRLVRIIDAHGGQQRLEYDGAGRVVNHTDCSQRTSCFSWDDLGHLQAVTNAAGDTVRYWRGIVLGAC